MPGDAQAPGDRQRDRRTEFGQGRRLLWFLADDHRELIIVTRVLRLGRGCESRKPGKLPQHARRPADAPEQPDLYSIV
jgi:hypothetical protein